MDAGFVVHGGEEYYCSDKCLHKHISSGEWNELYENRSDENYWTEWEDEENFEFYEDGSEVGEVE